jgi:LmbE family N-acetylglucosaminyl deacetylase
VLFIFAHNDDEFFALPRIERELELGNRVICVYTTDGAAYGISPSKRLQESYAVLGPRGVQREDIIALGTELGVRDGLSFQHINRLWPELQTATRDLSISRVYAPSWEGGHVDHDVAHLLSVALSRAKGAALYEFALYHGHQVRPPFFKCMQLIPAPGELLRDRISLIEALRWLASVRHYRSQWKTFLGLIGFCLKGILLKRELAIRAVPVRNYLHPPHKRPLFYETRFRVPYEQFLEQTRSFIVRVGAEGVGSGELTTDSRIAALDTFCSDARTAAELIDKTGGS